MKDVLLIGPKFFNYMNTINDALQNMGYSVDYFDERGRPSVNQKIIIRLNIPVVSGFVKRKLKLRLYRGVGTSKYKKIIIINPEILNGHDVNSLVKGCGCEDHVVYFWDSVKNKTNFLSILNNTSNILTFDKKDAERYGVKYFPLFYSKSYEFSKGEKKDIDFCFIGTAHSDRYRLVGEISRQLESYGLKGFIYHYLPTRKIYYGRKILGKRYGYGHIDSFNFNSMEENEVSNIVKRSKIVIDIQHPSQSGLTSRTIEALGANCKIITTNNSITEESFYDPACVKVIDRNEIKIPKEFVEEKCEFDARSVIDLRVDNWVRILLGSKK